MIDAGAIILTIDAECRTNENFYAPICSLCRFVINNNYSATSKLQPQPVPHCGLDDPINFVT